MHLRGFCWEREIEISSVEKKKLAKSLYQLAPKSLGDSGDGVKAHVSLGSYTVIHFIFIVESPTLLMSCS